MLFSELNIIRTKATPYHPNSNGKVEIGHKTLNSILAKLLEAQDQRKWDEFIPAALLAYRVSVSETTRRTPFFLVYGRDPQLPMDTLLGPKLRYMGDEYVPTMLSRLHRAFTAVKDNVREARLTLSLREATPVELYVGRGKRLLSNFNTLFSYFYDFKNFSRYCPISNNMSNLRNS